MNIEVLLTEAEIADEFAESMEARDLPEKFFYWTPPSVKAWQALAGRRRIPASNMGGAGRQSGRSDQALRAKVPVISFGAGDGLQDRGLLKALRAAGRELKYYPVDASQILLEMACAGAEDDDSEALGIKADISSPMHLLLAADVSEAPRLFLMVGNTLGGFDPLDQIRHVASAPQGRPADSGRSPSRRRPIAPTEEQKRFVFAPLARWEWWPTTVNWNSWKSRTTGWTACTW